MSEQEFIRLKESLKSIRNLILRKRKGFVNLDFQFCVQKITTFLFTKFVIKN